MSKPTDEFLAAAFGRERNVRDAAPRVSEAAEPILGRLVARIALVLLLLTGLDLVIRAALPIYQLIPYMSSEVSYTVKVPRLRAEPAPDVLLLGSSRVRDGIVPEIFEQRFAELRGRPASVFNLGLPAARIEEDLAIVRSHLPDSAPRLVVLGVTGSELVEGHRFDFAARYLWRWPDVLDYVRRVPEGEFEVTHLEEWLGLELCRRWYLFAQRDAARAWFVDAVDGVLRSEEQEVAARTRRAARGQAARSLVLAPRGYVPPDDGHAESLPHRLRRAPESIQIPASELDDATEPIVDGEFPELRALAALLAQRGSRLVVVEMPVSPYFQQLNPVLHGPVFRERLAALASEVGFDWVAMPAEETHLGNMAYLDASHLSSAGAVRFTRLLFDRLHERGCLDTFEQ